MSTFSFFDLVQDCTNTAEKLVPENSTTSLWNPSLVNSGDRSLLQAFTPKLSMKFKLTPSSSSQIKQAAAVHHPSQGICAHASLW